MTEVTVLLPVYNESNEFCIKSIESVLNQTLKEIYVYITLDNPENNRLKQLIESYSEKDNRISFWVNESNQGLPKTLNTMIDKTRTKYIARMDADDISDITRLEIQYKYMKKYPNIDLCGTNIIYIDDEGKEIHRKGNLPTNMSQIRKALKYLDVFCHPTFFGKTSVFKKMKYRNLKYAQDYDLICRLTENGYHLKNINMYLLQYRASEVSARKRLEQQIIGDIIQKNYKKKVLSSADIEEAVSIKLNSIQESQIEKYNDACQDYEAGVINMKKRKIATALIFMAKSCLRSGLHRKNIWKAFVYRKLIMKG